MQAPRGSTAGENDMNTRRIRSLLWLMTSVSLAATAVVIGWHLRVPPTIESTTQTTANDGALARVTPIDRAYVLVDQASLVQAAHKDIRQRLFDPPVETPKPPPLKPLPPIELVSTILRGQHDHSAWVRDGQNTRKVAVGDRLGPDNNHAMVMAITAERLVLEHEGKRVEIEQATAGGGQP